MKPKDKQAPKVNPPQETSNPQQNSILDDEVLV